MLTLQEMERKLKTINDLHTVVRSMKSLAAVNIHQYEEANRSLNEYFRSVEFGLRAFLLSHQLINTTPGPLMTLLIIFGSDQGMAGRFNEAIVEYAQSSLAERNEQPEHCMIWVAGSKALGLTTETFGRVDRGFDLPNSVDNITVQVQQLLLALASLRQSKGELRLNLYHNAPAGGSSYQQTCVNLLPPERLWLESLGGQQWPGRQIPLYRIQPEELFSALIGEYLFVALFRAYAASLAAENAARLASMQRAERNIEENKDELTNQYHTMRQNTISEELFDVVSGFEVISGSEDASGTLK